LTLLQLNPQHQVAVVEYGHQRSRGDGQTGGNQPRHSRSDHEYSTRSPAGLKSADSILAEKGRLLQSLGRKISLSSIWIDERLPRVCQGLAARQITYSVTDPSAEVHAFGKGCITMIGAVVSNSLCAAENIDVFLPQSWELHQARNAVAAAAAAYALGVSASPRGARTSQSSAGDPAHASSAIGRWHSHRHDTYNCQSCIVVAAVEALLPCVGDRPFMVVPR